jgi:hypothetical protein
MPESLLLDPSFAELELFTENASFGVGICKKCTPPYK